MKLKISCENKELIVEGKSMQEIREKALTQLIIRKFNPDKCKGEWMKD